jgi:hypothetical protein
VRSCYRQLKLPSPVLRADDPRHAADDRNSSPSNPVRPQI